ncbi:MAG: hypothetical protein ABDK87_01635 [Atribacterota bacterium]
MEDLFLALDPGREKVGVAVLRGDGGVVFRAVFPLAKLEEALEKLKKQYTIFAVILGGSTGSDTVLPILKRMGFQIHYVDERGSSEEARKLYLEENRVRGWKKVVTFISFLLSSRSLDDWQAIVIGRRFLGSIGHE